MDYVGINAKIKAMRSKLLKTSDFESLSHLRNVEELGIKLKEYDSYKRVIEEAEELSRDPIERKLTVSLISDFVRINRFISDFNVRKFLEAYFLKHEILIIKNLLCIVFDERDITYTLTELNLMLGKFLNVDLAKLVSSKSVPEFIENLKGTQFHKVLSNIYDSDVSLFELEMQLDLYYYLNLKNAQKKYLNKKDRDVVEHLIGAEVDIRNIMWICRFKSYYNLNPSVMYAYLIPIHYHLKSGDIQKMVEAKSQEELIAEIGNTKYKSMIDTSGSMENEYYKVMLKLYNKYELLHRDTVATIISYIFYKELEVSNVTSLLEGIRYSLRPNEILSYLYLPYRAEVS